MLAVGIVNRNHGKYLAECINSLLAQSRPPDKIVLIDDASEDNSLEVMKEYELEPDIEVHAFKEHIGHITGYNKALEIAYPWKECLDSHIFSIMAADDVMLDCDYYAEALALLQSRPNCGFVTTGLQWMDAEGKKLDHNSCLYSKETHGEIVTYRTIITSQELHNTMKQYGNVVNGGATLIRAPIQKKCGGYDPDFPYTADWKLWIQALSHCSTVGIVPRLCYGYRRHEGSMTMKSDPNRHLAQEIERQKCIELLNV